MQTDMKEDREAVNRQRQNMLPMLNAIQLEIDAHTKISDGCLNEKQPGEIVIGEVPATLRKVYMLMLEYKKREEILDVEIQFLDKNGEERQAKEAESEQASSYAGFYRSLFWLAFRRQFDKWGGSYGVRKGWVAVQVPDNRRRADDVIEQLIDRISQRPVKGHEA